MVRTALARAARIRGVPLNHVALTVTHVQVTDPDGYRVELFGH